MTSPAEFDHADRLQTALTVLSRCYLGPLDDDTLARIRSAALLATWPLTGDPASDAGVALWAASREAGETAEQLEADYRALFVGPGPVKAVPYESVHRSLERLLFQEETLEVRRAYAAFGLAAPRLNREPDDHVGLELEFVATLLQRAITAWDEGQDETADDLIAGAGEFTAHHLQPWVPGLIDLIATAATTHFYRGLAALTAGALAWATR